MKPEQVFKRYDIRGKYPEEIDEKFAELLGKSYGTFVLENDVSKVVLTTDTKASSSELKRDLVKSLKSTGIKVLDAGVGPTDYTALIGKKNSVFSVQVTSSHLNLDTNGFKFMYPEGNSLVNEDLEQIREIFRTREFSEGDGKTEDVSETSHDLYIWEVEKLMDDLDLKPKKSVYLETLSGAGSEFLPDLLKSHSAGLEHSDKAVDPPDPSAHIFDELEEKVDSGEHDLGIVTDMDADRAHLYFRGQWIDGSTVLALLAQAIEPEKMVVSLDTSRRLHGSFKGKIFETKVGDPFVLNKMVEEGAAVGGEPNYHFAFLDFVPYNSGTLTSMIAASIDMERIIDKIPERAVLRESYEVKNKEKVMTNVLRELKDKFEILSEKDGIKFREKDVNVLLRKSGTSDKIRLVVDAPDQSKADEVSEKIKRIIKKQQH